MEAGSFQNVWCCVVTVEKVLINITDKTYVKPLSEVYVVKF
jgi:hypothetical protein